MKRFYWSLLVLAVLVALVAQRQRWFSGHAQMTGAGLQAQGLPNTGFITTARPVRRDFQHNVPWTGEVESQQQVAITALEAGRIITISAVDDSTVAKDAALMQLGGPQVQSRLAVMHATIAAWRERLALAQQGVAHKRQAVTEKVTALGELLQAQDELIQLQAGLATALETQQAFTARLTLQAPFPGVFTQRRVSVGQDVDAGTVLATLLDPTHLRIEATVFLADAAALHGRTAVVRRNAATPVRGTVSHTLPARTPAGGTRCWIEGEAINQALRPGQVVLGTLLFDTRTAALAVPQSAVVYDTQERPYVFVQRHQKFIRQRVHVGLTADGWVEIRDGLKETDEVVTQGAYEFLHADFNQVYKVTD